MNNPITNYQKILLNSFDKSNKNYIAFFVFSGFWITLLTLSGTIKSGFHFTDDHEIIRINEYINSYGFWETLVSVIKNDLQIRFRPVYFFHRVLLTNFFGTNFFIWSINYLVLAVLTSYFLFQFCFKQGFSFTISLIFPFIVLLGSQAAVWWRLGPCEGLGMFFLSFSIYCLVSSIYDCKKKLFYASTALIFIVSLVKESFLLFIPAYMVLVLCLEYKISPSKTILTVLKNNIKTLAFLTLILIIELIVISKVIGTNKIGYAGVDNTISLQKILDFIYNYLLYNSYANLILFGIFLYLQNFKYYNLSIKNNFFSKTIALEFLIMLLIILPQFVLYFKSGLGERYLLPLNFGFAYFIVVLYRELSSTLKLNKFSIYTFLGILILLLWSFFKNETWQSARIFTKEGIYTNKFIDKIKENTQQNDTILIVLNSAENYEWGGYSLRTVLKTGAKFSNIYFYLSEDTTHTGFFLELDSLFKLYFKNEIISRINGGFSKIAVLPFTQKKSIINKLDSIYQIVPEEIGNYSLYQLRKK